MSEVLRDFPEVNGLYIFRCEPAPLVNQVSVSGIDVFWASWHVPSNEKTCFQSRGIGMVKSRLCENARPLLQNSRPRLKRFHQIRARGNTS